MSSASTILHRPSGKRPASPGRGAARIAILYLVFAIAWIPLANFFFRFWVGPARAQYLENIEYLAFALGSGVLIYLLVVRFARQRAVIEDALRRNERRYRSLVLATAQVTWRGEPSGEIAEPQPTWEAFTGQTFAQYRGWGWLEAVHPDDRAHLTERWRKAVSCATEVCMQGGIHPQYTGQTYLDIVAAVKAAEPAMHVHAFSPLEVWQGAATLKIPLREFLTRLKAAGLGTLPGTAAEVLDDEVRKVICPDKINTAQWFEVMRTAHEVGFKTTATIMYGHVERYENWARHLLRLRAQQTATGGFTEFVPLPFVHMEAPLYLKGRARKGPTFREAVLMHAVARLALNPLITNIQASWVKMGHAGVVACLSAGVNDLGGTLMNESITRAAGASHGQETNPLEMLAMIESAGRMARQRSTAYGEVSTERVAAGREAGALTEIVNTPAQAYERLERRPLVRNPAVGA